MAAVPTSVADRRLPLLVSGSVALDASGNGTVRLGPSSNAGPANWHITGVIVQTNRPGQAPVPRVQVYKDQEDPSGSLGLSYDGSFNQGRADEYLSRGSQIIAVWTGGQVGDRAHITLTGEKWS